MLVQTLEMFHKFTGPDSETIPSDTSERRQHVQWMGTWDLANTSLLNFLGLSQAALKKAPSKHQHIHLDCTVPYNSSLSPTK